MVMGELGIKNVNIIDAQVYEDGRIVVYEFRKEIDFLTKRVFFINWQSPLSKPHAHKNGWQLHFCVIGVVHMRVYDGNLSREIIISETGREGLLIGPGVWHSYKFENSNTRLIAISSTNFNMTDYIRNWEEFNEWVKAGKF